MRVCLLNTVSCCAHTGASPLSPIALSSTTSLHQSMLKRRINYSTFASSPSAPASTTPAAREELSLSGKTNRAAARGCSSSHLYLRLVCLRSRSRDGSCHGGDTLAGCKGQPGLAAAHAATRRLTHDECRRHDAPRCAQVWPEVRAQEEASHGARCAVCALCDLARTVAVRARCHTAQQQRRGEGDSDGRCRGGSERGTQ